MPNQTKKQTDRAVERERVYGPSGTVSNMLLRRVGGRLEIRAEPADGSGTSSGGDPQIFLYGSVTGRSYEVSDWLGEYTETVEPGAFRNSLRENPDVVLLVNHEGLPLARTSKRGSGSLSIGEDEIGFWGLADVDLERADASVVYRAVKAGT